ncbi:phosphoribosylanthranilate isomerase [Clostridium sp. 19966]|uniref:phosphoribosylanthranilate isomerase n=1 Tax=Clostridium sp. 19966 TaxID=2768166 RepID=UPI0028DDF93B|nr:phosphoribosylanthranilate isomerase [Clostridium sp. 19966]MDT8717090.1 phosphoribosylanthranilate isomerase [Clostridium sp. 19966]
MVKVKICGIRRIEDVYMMNELKPDYVGFVFAESKRKVSIEEAERLSRELDKDIKKVGVFLEQDLNFIKAAFEKARLDIIQLHGENQEVYCKSIDFGEVWRAVRISSVEDIENIKREAAAGILLDSKIEGSYGGSGKSFEWKVAEDIGKSQKIILAGGLNESNVKEGIRIVKPYAVDVSSGVEVNGFKDYEKCKSFIRKVKEA